MTETIAVHQLSKRYKEDTVVDELTFELEPNKIYGLVGRNGAGKTTLLRMLAGQLAPSQGSVTVLGEPPYDNNRILTRLCLIKESQQYPSKYRVSDVLNAAQILYPDWDAGYAADLLREFELPGKRMVNKLSRGMLSALGIVVGLASRAPVTLFDEPYLGLDAVARERFYEQLLIDYAEHPRTFVISTHLIDEISRVLEHVLVIDKGRLLLSSDTEQLRGNACMVIGPAQAVEKFVVNRRVMNRTPIGGYVKAVVLDTTPESVKQEAERLGIEVSPVTLQQYVIQLTGRSGDGAYEQEEFK
ncbi:ABC transporter ATP-binding protein [Paenibacillus sp. CN-4]|uniref:ABC transporter ATP-binding protein n=1 Tax=Paenibacillus nanchangensis TaxID=3348343 RepID=UPI003979669E